MALSAEDIQAIGSLVKQELEPKFEAIDKRFEQVDKRFEQVDKRFEEVDNRFERFFEHFESRFAQVDARFERVDARLDQVLDALEGFAQRDGKREQEYLSMREQLGRVEKRVDKLEEQAA
ncbi:MAG: hypothetical protein NXI31_05990 [bacterium]|nr:hypothetical protein [bacterium]